MGGYEFQRLSSTVNALVSVLLEKGVLSRATARLVDVQKNTVLRVHNPLAGLSSVVQDPQPRRLRLQYIQAEEIYSFVGKREVNILPSDREKGRYIGETWIFLV